VEAAEERDNVEESNIKKILCEHRCEWKHCSNFGRACIVAGKRHYKLNSNDLKQWDIAIIRGQATAKLPPLDLHPIAANSSKKRRQDHGSSDSDSNGPASQRKRRDSGGHNINLNLQYPPVPAERSKRRYHSSSPPSSPIKRGHSRRARTSSASLFSSPSIKAISLSEYITCLVDKSQEDAEEYSQALQTLQSNHIKVHQLSKLSTAEWKELDISVGMRRSLKTELLHYKADTKRGKV
jgi:hypothetical protein